MHRYGIDSDSSVLFSGKFKLLDCQFSYVMTKTITVHFFPPYKDFPSFLTKKNKKKLEEKHYRFGGTENQNN